MMNPSLALSSETVTFASELSWYKLERQMEQTFSWSSYSSSLAATNSRDDESLLQQ